MGYNTEFEGRFELDRPLTIEHKRILDQFSDTRHDNISLGPLGNKSIWCNWVPSSDGTAIVYNEQEKFYDYAEWIQYLIEKFLKPWGYTVNGEVSWFGESRTDVGKIIVKNNVVTKKRGKVVIEI